MGSLIIELMGVEVVKYTVNPTGTQPEPLKEHLTDTQKLKKKRIGCR
jgi:hypothetical protein